MDHANILPVLIDFESNICKLHNSITVEYNHRLHGFRLGNWEVLQIVKILFLIYLGIAFVNKCNYV